MDPVLALILAHKWLALAALGIGLVVRLLKSDTKIPIDIPPRLRVWAALGLGIVAGVIDKVANGGTPWKDALLWGLSAAITAIVAHATVVDSLRGGREFVVPGLIKPGVPPGPGKPPSIRPPPSSNGDDPPPTTRDGKGSPPTALRDLGAIGLVIAIAASPIVGSLAAGVLVAACTPAEKRGVRTGIDVATEGCQVLHAAGNGTVDQICAEEEELAPIIKHLFAARKWKETHAGAPSSASSVPFDACLVPISKEKP